MKKGSWIWLLVGGGALYLLLKPKAAGAATAPAATGPFTERTTTTVTKTVNEPPPEFVGPPEPPERTDQYEEIQRPKNIDGYAFGVYGSYEIDRSGLHGFGCPGGCGGR